jgi:nucleoside-diphosphate-sugar epimerase
MNIFITGVNSFVGKVLISSLKEYPLLKIYGCDLKIKKKNNNFFSVDIRNKNFFKKVPKNIDTIIHLAAISRDNDCSNDLANCFLTNVVGTLNIIEAAKKLKIKKIIFASTEWVYPDILAKNPINEKSDIPYSLLKSDYAKSKLISEFHLKDFYESNKYHDVSIIRFGIIYGERKSNWSAVESIFNNIKNKKIIKVGSLKTSRRFIHVKDVCEGIIKSIQLKKFNLINLQGKELVTLDKIISISKSILKKKILVIESNKKNPSIRNISSFNSVKKISFKPKISLKEGLINLNNFFCK